jgi:hypothetical protein
LFGIGFRRRDINGRREGEGGGETSVLDFKKKDTVFVESISEEKYIHRYMRFGLKEDKAMIQVSKYVEVSILISLGGILFGYLPTSVLQKPDSD